MGDSDTDLAEAMARGDMQRAQLTNLLCHELADVCTSKPPKVPKVCRQPQPARILNVYRRGAVCEPPRCTIVCVSALADSLTRHALAG
jgi:hypothetical protein